MNAMSLRSMRRLLLATGAALPLAFVPASPVAAGTPLEGAGSGTATVGVASDAWYAAAAACEQSPTGCLPVGQPAASAYPAKTLQVGVLAGQEESRAYLQLNLTSLPAGTTIAGGQLRLPVAGSEDGTRAADTATLQACLATGSVKDDAEGSTEAPPKTDCKAATSPAKYVAPVGSAPAMFTVDLSPFAEAWTGGASALVLLPAADTSPASAWHVALSAHDRSVAPALRPSATVTYSSAADGVDAPTSFDAAPPPTDISGSGSASFAAPPLASTSTPELPAVTAPTVPDAAPAPVVQAAPQLQPQAAVSVGGYSYPGVFLLPILLAVAGGWVGRALTRDLTP